MQPNKAIVGRNAFAHESGIHQDGVLKERTTYEIMDATTVGLDANSIVLGKHSGRHALQQALAELGFEVSGQTLNTAFKRFKEIADKKKQVTAMDLEALVTDELREEMAGYSLEWFDVEAPRAGRRTRRVGIIGPRRRGADRLVHRRRPGRRDLPRDQRRHRRRRPAAGVPRRRGHRRPGRARRDVGGARGGRASTGSGQGVSTDILEAAARAYVRALSNALRRRGVAAEAEAASAEAAAEPVRAP